jgi:VacB/RNase II family 3'-5' exoribonuclease
MKKAQATRDHRSILQNIAHKAMIEKELLPDFSPEAITQLQQIERSSVHTEEASRDLRQLPWCSIDNDDSRDLDQLTVAQPQANGIVKIFVAIADVDCLVKKASPIDDHAKHNTTSIYTAAEIFPMLPQKLSTDLTSLNFEQDRNAVVVEMDISEEGKVKGSGIYSAAVRNYAKLAYNSVAAWLDGTGTMPEGISKFKGLEENIRLQDNVAQLLLKNRYEHGALDLETIQTRPVFSNEIIKDLQVERKNRAKELIENFMITANTVTAEFLRRKGIPSLRRVVRQPK